MASAVDAVTGSEGVCSVAAGYVSGGDVSAGVDGDSVVPELALGVPSDVDLAGSEPGCGGSVTISVW